MLLHTVISHAVSHLIAHQKQKMFLLHTNAPQNVTGVLNVDGSVSLSWDAVPKAKSYIPHYTMQIKQIRTTPTKWDIRKQILGRYQQQICHI